MNEKSQYMVSQKKEAVGHMSGFNASQAFCTIYKEKYPLVTNSFCFPSLFLKNTDQGPQYGFAAVISFVLVVLINLKLIIQL